MSGTAAQERLDRELKRLRRESEERYRDLYENIPFMYFTVGRNGTVLRVNTMGARELGYTAEELIGEPVTDVFHPDDRAAAIARIAQCVEEPGKVLKWDLRKRRKDGSVMWVHESARAIPDGDGLVVLVVCENVTERKLAERQLLDHQQTIQALALDAALAEERERKRIAAGLHDDVGQNLALAKRMLVELRQPGVTADPALVDRLLEVEERIGQTIDSIRSLTFELSSPVLYVLGLEAALKDLGERIVATSGSKFRFETDGQPKLLGEESTIVLFRVTRELLVNCVKHAGASGVEVEVSRADDKIQVTVSDDGVGIPPSTQKSGSLFCAGFGLWNARRQVTAIGGTLALEPRDPRGLRVVLTTPLQSVGEIQ